MNSDLLLMAQGRKKADLVLKGGQVVDVFNEQLFQADVAIGEGTIVGLGEYQGKEEIKLEGQIITPGFIDSHLHLESAMVQVEEFAQQIIPQGTTTVVADPHEIANVAGLEGIKYLLTAGRHLPWNFYLLLPSCVPTTSFARSGADLPAEKLAELLAEKEIFGLGEVMDYPGLINGEENLWRKIDLVGDKFKDGHAPGLKNKELNTYLLSGIKADHEVTTKQEAKEKISKGMYVMIREGSAGKELKKLLPAVTDANAHRFTFVTDDRHPGGLVEEGHINFIIKKAVAEGMSPLRAVKLATLNPAVMLGMDNLGAVAPGYQADLTVINNFKDFKVKRVFKSGKQVAKEGQLRVGINKAEIPEGLLNSVKLGTVKKEDFELPPGEEYRVIKLTEGSLLTEEEKVKLSLPITIEQLQQKKLTKIAVLERHNWTGDLGLGLLKGLGLKTGAIATSIAHDSHNIIVTGIDNKSMQRAVRELETRQGGIVVVEDGEVLSALSLPIAGLLTEKSVEETAAQLKELKEAAYSLGVETADPFLLISFMGLPVIPKLKLTPDGLFDVDKFDFVPLCF